MVQQETNCCAKVVAKKNLKLAHETHQRIVMTKKFFELVFFLTWYG